MVVTEPGMDCSVSSTNVCSFQLNSEVHNMNLVWLFSAAATPTCVMVGSAGLIRFFGRRWAKEQPADSPWLLKGSLGLMLVGAMLGGVLWYYTER